MKDLIAIQNELKAPKGQYNSFGKYKYRSCEDILEAVKPLLEQHGCMLLISDSLEQIGERYYVKATATIMTSEEHVFTASAYAREPENKKGMDESQITGTASSYARKYALNGLFLIDDTKDADTDENRNERTGRAEAQKMEDGLKKKLTKKDLDVLKKSITDAQAEWALKAYQLQDLSQMTYEMKADFFRRLNEQKAKNGK